MVSPSINDIRAIAIDLDGTVLRSNEQMSARTVAVLQKCLARGIAVIIATGRSVNSAEPHRRLIGTTGAMVFANGAHVLDVQNGENGAFRARVVERHDLDTDIAAFCAELSAQTGAYYQAFFTASDDITQEFIVTGEERAETAFYRRRTGLDIRANGFDAAFAEVAAGRLRCVKGLFVAESTLIDEIRPRIAARFGERTALMTSWPTFLEVLPPGISKGTGLRAALAERSLKPEHTIAFGDEENDIPMLQAARFSAAPENARDTVLAIAQYHIASNDEDGVAAFLERIAG